MKMAGKAELASFLIHYFKRPMNFNRTILFDRITDSCRQLEEEFHLIPNNRKSKLAILGDYFSEKFNAQQTPKVIVICTHNARRSHIGQLWLAVAADYFGLPSVRTFSGGTEATAVNLQTIAALKRIGFVIVEDESATENPVYQITWKEGMTPLRVFSKKYDADPNPKENFAAIMVCSEADGECPYVSGCDLRLSLPYDDPKEADGSEYEVEKYDQTARQIGREILYSLSRVNPL